MILNLLRKPTETIMTADDDPKTDLRYFLELFLDYGDAPESEQTVGRLRAALTAGLDAVRAMMAAEVINEGSGIQFVRACPPALLARLARAVAAAKAYEARVLAELEKGFDDHDGH
jgi:hypothetical protein